MKRPDKKKRVFLGCEGESEESYGKFLEFLSEKKKLGIHIVKPILGGGDTFALAKKAVNAYENEKQKGGIFEFKAVMLDTDMPFDLFKKRQNEAIRSLGSVGLIAIWQEQNHEALLLRHFEGHERDDPPAKIALYKLQAVWPEYHKNMSAYDLARKLSLDHVKRAARVTPKLNKFLVAIGLID